jgi:hypothetical protein
VVGGFKNAYQLSSRDVHDDAMMMPTCRFFLIFAKRSYIRIPTVGTAHTHRGHGAYPPWVRRIPTVGTAHTHVMCDDCEWCAARLFIFDFLETAKYSNGLIDQ